MDLSELLNSPMGQSIVKSVAGQLGMNEKEASGVVNMAVPALLAGMTRNAQSSDGAESLNKALETKHDGSLLNNLSGILQGNTKELQQDGNGILGHVFGNNLSSVEQGISQKTGVSMNKVTPLLAMLAPVVMAYLGKQKRQTNTGAGGLGDLLGSLLGGGQQKSRSGGGIMDMLGSALDKDGDGNPLNDILGGFLGGR
ncbi:MAG: DUF937 domain-containing protein [Proteiniphilum sp.]|jgi:hypothetical protein|uniref:DUF937 domain-containing protein n=1 Tax=Proteiniphilum sp. TaxID=1926877 RepID=UPI002B20D965|nr:DUF937 domain-containing protein [Proteiniphilum sp.]MEA5062157.1 DUF937 domain-containing protein [Petrimonas sp.]MEA5128926.1 DUF937 domain-containing protein [Proteiniphilum sp.]